jgi:hypothetical protein
VNKPPSNTAIFPWSTAGKPGALDVVWYGTDYFASGIPPDKYPPGAAWYVYFAQNLQAATIGSSFTQVVATPVIHYGGVCEGGVSCTGNRDLYDDFGVAASPVTGLASIIYSDDQYTNTPAEPAQPGCTPARNNSIFCDRTNIATQTSGPGINPPPNVCETTGEDFEDLNVNGNHQSDFSTTEECRDNGGQSEGRSIQSIDVRLNGLPLPLTWSTSLPLKLSTTTSQSLSARTTIMPLGLLPIVGKVYVTTTTITLSDGTRIVKTANVIYTLGAKLGL